MRTLGRQNRQLEQTPIKLPGTGGQAGRQARGMHARTLDTRTKGHDSVQADMSYESEPASEENTDGQVIISNTDTRDVSPTPGVPPASLRRNGGLWGSTMRVSSTWMVLDILCNTRTDEKWLLSCETAQRLKAWLFNAIYRDDLLNMHRVPANGHHAASGVHTWSAGQQTRRRQGCSC